jgi:asparagine synthase (glutamine-hydrolysing)
MCGIAGKVSAQGGVDPALLERMRRHRHRGPDSRGTFVEPGVGLGIQRLRVIDWRLGTNRSRTRMVVVVLNGEITTIASSDELEGRGHRSSTCSDTEVLVHSTRIAAMTASRPFVDVRVAIWDRRRRRLLLARDRLGKKPLFYAERNGELWFASEAMILQDPAIPRDMDPAAIDAFLRLQYAQSGERLPGPAQAAPRSPAGWEDGRSKISRYWQLSMFQTAVRLRGGDERTHPRGTPRGDAAAASKRRSARCLSLGRG